MPALPLRNHFGGGVSGNTIATSDSGSGDAWSVVTIGTGATFTYDTAHAHSGTLAAKAVEPATNQVIHCDWTGIGSLTTAVFGRIYCYFTALPNNQLWLMGALTNAPADAAYLLINGTNGTISALNAAFATINTGVKIIPINEWVRIEWRIVASATVGQFDWKLFSSVSPGDGGDGTTPTESLTSTSQNTGANLNEIDWCIVRTAAPTSQSFWFDDIALTSAGWLGPTVTAEVSPSPRPIPFQAQGRNL